VSICSSVPLSIIRSVRLSISPLVYLSFCLSAHLSICPFVYLPICLSVHSSFFNLPICPSVHPSAYLLICLCVYLSICITVYFSICPPVNCHLFNCPSVCLCMYWFSICSSVYQSIIYHLFNQTSFLSFPLSVFLPICYHSVHFKPWGKSTYLFICLWARLSTHLFIWLSICLFICLYLLPNACLSISSFSDLIPKLKGVFQLFSAVPAQLIWVCRCPPKWNFMSALRHSAQWHSA
jgi:hypothetical protein